MRLDLKIVQKGLIIVCVPLVLQLAVMTAIFQLIQEADDTRIRDSKQRTICEDMIEVQTAFFSIGYHYWAQYKGLEKKVKGRGQQELEHALRIRGELWDLMKDDPEQAGLWEFTNEKLKLVLADYYDLRSLVKSRARFSDILWKMDEFLRNTQTAGIEMITRNRILLEPMKEYIKTSALKERQLRQTQFSVSIVGLVLSVMAALVLARVFITDIINRLKLVGDNTLRLTSDQPLHPELQGKDEIAEFDRTFHKMAYALKQASEKEAAVFENASDVICVLDDKLRFARINAASSRLWGYAPQELLGTAMMSLINEEDHGSTLKIIEGTKNGERSASFENRLRVKAGSEMDILWSVYWSDAENSLFCVAHDITERKQLERMKQEFLAMVSHDLRSPLASIFGVFQLLAVGAYGQLPQMATERLDRASKNVNRLLALVNDLLDMEKLEAGELSLEVKTHSVKELLTRSTQEVEELARQKGITIEVAENDFEAPFDEERMIQVLVNLLSNAIKFSPDSGTVTVKAVKWPQHLQIDVTDQGRGIPKDHIESVFERFKQVRSEDGQRSKGTGLGLPICKQIVERHGGNIGVESEEGKGSTFWLRIPLLSQATTLALPKVQKVEKQPEQSAEVATAELADAPRATSLSTLMAKLSPANLNLFAKGGILIGVPVLSALIFSCYFTVLFFDVERASLKETGLRAISTSGMELLNLYYQVGSSVIGDRNQQSWLRFQNAVREIRTTHEDLVKSVSVEPEFAQILKKAEEGFEVINEWTKNAEATMQAAGEYSPYAHREATRDSVSLMTHVYRVCEAMKEVVAAAKDYRTEVLRESLVAQKAQRELVLYCGIALNSILALGLTAFFTKGLTVRLKRLSENTSRLITEQPLLPPLKGNDEIARLDAVFHAMTEALREARQKERAIFDNSQDVICALDPEGRFTRINPACLPLWGYAPEELLEKTIYDIIPEEEKAFVSGFLPGKDSPSPTASFEHSIIRKDGTRQDTLFSAQWSADEQRIFCVAHDISKRKELQRLKQEFLAIVSHDLRTPLTAIVGIAKLARANAFGEMPEKATKQMDVVIRNCDRLLNLINDLLDIEKLESGQMSLSLTDVPVGELLERSQQALEHLAQQKHIKVAIEPNEQSIAADADRLVQVLVNLLSNAVKFSPDESVVTLSAKDLGDFVEIRVTDQGRGIPESHLASIFDRFRQVESTDGKRRSGTGLGLPICKQIVEQHGGTIGVDSTLNSGSTFWVRIPKVKADVIAIYKQPQ